MSPRPSKSRKILNPPSLKGFKPYGNELKQAEESPVFLLYEEYESIRLCDYEGINHVEASALMNISRPTFTRIYAVARGKIARAFVEARQIVIEGGKVYFDSEWSFCRDCQCFFNNPDKTREITHCPLCGSKQFEPLEEGCGEDQWDTLISCSSSCYCPQCGYEQKPEPGQICGKVMCPQCTIRMVKKTPENVQVQ